MRTSRRTRDLVEDLLQDSDIPFEVVRAQTRAQAVNTLLQHAVDIVLLDLNLPDDQGLSSLKAVREAAPDTPTVVLTAIEDEQLALSCINAGAQDYLLKGELRQASLRRTLSYAITRMRESQIRELRDTLDKYRSLTVAAQATTDIAPGGAAPLQQREPALFEDLVEKYRDLLIAYLVRRGGAVVKPHDLMERIATSLGDASAGPRDLIDLHLAALEPRRYRRNRSAVACTGYRGPSYGAGNDGPPRRLLPHWPASRGARLGYWRRGLRFSRGAPAPYSGGRHA